MKKAVLQAAEHTLLHGMAGDCRAVGANGVTLVANSGASVPGLVDKRVACPATSALDQTGKQVGRAPPSFRSKVSILYTCWVHLLSHGVLALLHPVPKRFVHEAQLWHLLDDPGLRRVGPCLALSCLRVLDEALSVPDPAAKVEFVVQNAGAPLGVPGNS